MPVTNPEEVMKELKKLEEHDLKHPFLELFRLHRKLSQNLLVRVLYLEEELERLKED